MSVSIMQTMVFTQITHICSYLNPVGYLIKWSISMYTLRLPTSVSFFFFFDGLVGMKIVSDPLANLDWLQTTNDLG